jgi:hypothetical protein
MEVNMPLDFKPENVGELNIWVDALEKMFLEKFDDIEKEMHSMREYLRRIFLAVLSTLVAPLIVGMVIVLVGRK